jgi:hypothetical protein
MTRSVSISIFLGAIAVTALVVARLDAAERDEFRKIVELVKSDKDAGVKDAAKAYAVKHSEIDELMQSFRPAKKGGITEEGIDRSIASLKRSAPDAKRIAGLSDDVGCIPVAVARILERIPAPKGMPVEKWTKLSRTLGDEGLKLAGAIRRKDSGEIQNAAVRVEAACAACHNSFRFPKGIAAPGPAPAPPPAPAPAPAPAPNPAPIAGKKP